MRPNSVCAPVAKTTAGARPLVQLVPEKTASGASISRSAVSGSRADRVTGTDSPVNADRSTSSDPSMSRASALIRSPSSISSTSPGTTRSAATRRAAPERITRACGGRYLASACTARAACVSWANATTALIAMTAKIAQHTVGVPDTSASTAAANSNSANG